MAAPTVLSSRQVTDGLDKRRYLVPEWPAPSNVLAVSTQRGLSQVADNPLQGFNLAQHVNDNGAAADNRWQLQQDLQLTKSPAWLSQTHSTRIMTLPLPNEQASTEPVSNGLEPNRLLEADASVSKHVGETCVIMTADCLPVLFCDQQGTQVAAAHAGWRGLANGILENTVATFANPNDLLVWLGPAIGPQAFEVGEDVYHAFGGGSSFFSISAVPINATHKNQPQKYLANLYQLARIRLHAMGVQQVYGGDFCTFSAPDLFYSHRRDVGSGRQASLITLLATSV